MDGGQSSTYYTSFDHLTRGQIKSCQTALKVSAALSLCGSCFILYNLLGHKRKKELYKRTFARLLLGLSVCDVISSAAFIVGSAAMPSKSSEYYNFANLNVGNQLTSDVQGMVLQVFYFISIFYTACISVNFLLYVTYQWKEHQIRRRVEICMHLVAWIVPVLVASLCYTFDMYNPTAFFCYVVTYPIVSS